MEEISGRELVLAISCVFQQMAAKSKRLAYLPVTVFSCREIPIIPLRDYIERIFVRTLCSPTSLVLSIIYVDRFLHSSGMSITFLNVHKLLLTAIMLASKFVDDVFCNNAFFAEVGCVTLAEINQMEEVFLRNISFSLFVQEDEFIRYYSGLYQRVYMMFHSSYQPWSPNSWLDMDSMNRFIYPLHAQYSHMNPDTWNSPVISTERSYESYGYANVPMDRSSSFDSTEDTHWYSFVFYQTFEPLKNVLSSTARS